MNDTESFLIGLDHLNAMADPWHMRDPTDAQRAYVAAQMTGMLRLLNRTRSAENAPQEAAA